MYLSFEKSQNKLLYVKCITLNSLFILRIGSIKQINTCSIILKLYKCQINTNRTKDKENKYTSFISTQYQHPKR